MRKEKKLPQKEKLMKLYQCSLCGQIITKIKDTQIPVVCCGQEMVEIFPKHEDKVLGDKHVPVIDKKGNNVTITIGSVPHPMSKEHYIEWVVLETNKRSYRHCFKPGDVPQTRFIIDKDEKVEAVYVYCNLHSLWKK